jgi:hypothetical protein
MMMTVSAVKKAKRREMLVKKMAAIQETSVLGNPVRLQAARRLVLPA